MQANDLAAFCWNVYMLYWI